MRFKWDAARGVTLSQRERVAAKQPGEGLRRSRKGAEDATKRRRFQNQLATASRAAVAQRRNVSRGIAVARTPEPQTRRLEVSAPDTNGRACRRFLLRGGAANHRGGWQSPRRSGRTRSRAHLEDRSRRLSRAPLHKPGCSRSPGLGDRGNSARARCSADNVNATPARSDGLTARRRRAGPSPTRRNWLRSSRMRGYRTDRKNVLTPHPSPSPSPRGRGERSGTVSAQFGEALTPHPAAPQPPSPMGRGRHRGDVDE